MKKVISWLDNNIELTVCSVILCMLAACMLLQVFCRYFLNHALSWPEELSCYLHIWYAMLGISYATKYSLHLRVDTVINLLPEKLCSLMNIIADILMAVFYVYMIKTGIKVVSDVFTDNQLSSALKLPMWIVYASLLVGVTLAIIRLVQKWYHDIRKIKAGRKEVNA